MTRPSILPNDDTASSVSLVGIYSSVSLLVRESKAFCSNLGINNVSRDELDLIRVRLFESLKRLRRSSRDNHLVRLPQKVSSDSGANAFTGTSNDKNLGCHVRGGWCNDASRKIPFFFRELAE